MSVPTVSVVVPAYNAERHVAQTLDAILAQTHPADEIIVVDDGSTDGTPGVLAAYGAPVRVVRQPNRGHPGAYNRGFEEARGTYVARCDADDIWEPAKLERQVASLVAHPEVDIAFCGARFFELADGPYGPSPGTGLLDAQAFGATLFRANLVCSSSVVVRRALFERLGPFEERLACEDYDFWLRAVAAGAVFFYEPAELVRYRRHAEQVTHDRLAMEQATHRTHRRHAPRVADRSLAASVLAEDLARYARLLVDAGRPGEARTAFARSLRLRATPRTLAWTLLLAVPDRQRLAITTRLGALRRA
ncbi:MAG: glycosyl transferase [Solirubrobacterales bacterium]|nr:glycosyl transferase [Solirubrobacterales bacterium]